MDDGARSICFFKHHKKHTAHTYWLLSIQLTHFAFVSLFKDDSLVVPFFDWHTRKNTPLTENRTERKMLRLKSSNNSSEYSLSFLCCLPRNGKQTSQHSSLRSRPQTKLYTFYAECTCKNRTVPAMFHSVFFSFPSRPNQAFVAPHTAPHQTALTAYAFLFIASP